MLNLSLIHILIVTSKLMILLECKNLVGNIEIDSKGNFIRTIQYGKRYWKEGIYSPITPVSYTHLDVYKRQRLLFIKKTGQM